MVKPPFPWFDVGGPMRRRTGIPDIREVDCRAVRSLLAVPVLRITGGMRPFRMPSGKAELAVEVADWVESLPPAELGRVELHIDLLAERGPLLDQPYTRQLRGKLRELRFSLGSRGDAVRISYFITVGRRIILLTVFRKQRTQERTEIERAYRAMQRCMKEHHVADEDDKETA